MPKKTTKPNQRTAKPMRDQCARPVVVRGAPNLGKHRVTSETSVNVRVAPEPGPAAREWDFALIVAGIAELTEKVLDKLYESGCDDATIGLQHGLVYIEFSRVAGSLEDAVLSAISDVYNAGVGAEVLRVDECDLVTQAEIGRKIERSRQMVHQYITGQRGPGGFPPPACHLSGASPRWAWCEVSQWLARHNLIRPEESHQAVVIESINSSLERRRLPPGILDRIKSVFTELGI